MRHDVVFVLGHPGYYPRFGFIAASRHHIRWERNVPDEAFMVAELLPGALDGLSGVVHYRPEFDEV
jgi:putative acetyltransferase